MSEGLQGVSIAWLAEQFDKHRQTVAKKLSDAGLQPIGRKGTAKLFPVKESAEILCGAKLTDWTAVNPDELPPLEMQQFWNAQKAKAQTARENDKLLIERGMLLHYDNVEFAVAAMLKRLREGVLLIPDVIEAGSGLSSKQRKDMDKQIDLLLINLRTSISEMFNEEEDDDGGASSG